MTTVYAVRYDYVTVMNIRMPHCLPSDGLL